MRTGPRVLDLRFRLDHRILLRREVGVGSHPWLVGAQGSVISRMRRLTQHSGRLILRETRDQAVVSFDDLLGGRIAGLVELLLGLAYLGSRHRYLARAHSSVVDRYADREEDVGTRLIDAGIRFPVRADCADVLKGVRRYRDHGIVGALRALERSLGRVDLAQGCKYIRPTRHRLFDLSTDVLFGLRG